MMDLIDAHLHFFDLDKGDYQWLKPHNAPFWPDKPVIAQNWTESDLTLPSNLKLAGYVHIEAGFDNARFWREIAWLEHHNQLPFRSVACIDLTKKNMEFVQDLRQLRQYQTVVGVRHILDDDANSLLRLSSVKKNLEQLADHDFLFELQMPFTNKAAVEQLDSILSNIPHLSIIINHAGFPPKVSDEQFSLWVSNMRLIAKHPRVAIKCSGWEMSDREYDLEWALTVIEQCMYDFGQDRVMLASNFPLCLFSRDYSEYWQSFLNLPDDTKKALLSDNARRWYKF